ncbi:protein YIPF1 [Aplysia californica]|uniref:Protein YIPF1 n=1 Tax=Aplysia californica TaxID=6500 RepID=A0ABM0JR45_APLCA|nr:protein YIPF1 [Aplysia californica]
MDSLDFQDIAHDKADVEKGATHEFTNFPHSAADSDDDADDKEQLLKDEKKAASFWTFAYYQQFFDVETHQVGKRILSSMVPRPGKNYLVKQIRPNPDLYGPFWICTTLVFTTAIAGNLANYFSAAGKSYHWQYDFHKVTYAATAIFSYWWLVPLALFGVLWWRSRQTNESKFTFLEIICVYGYSLAIYVPISILWAIQVSWLQWLLVVLGATLSGSVLLLTFWPAVSEDNKKIAIGLMIFIFVMHAALAAGFVLYFFYVPAPETSPSPLTPIANTTLPQLPGHLEGDSWKQQTTLMDKNSKSKLLSFLTKSEQAGADGKDAKEKADMSSDVKKSTGTGPHQSGSVVVQPEGNKEKTQLTQGAGDIAPEKSSSQGDGNSSGAAKKAEHVDLPVKLPEEQSTQGGQSGVLPAQGG